MSRKGDVRGCHGGGRGGRGRARGGGEKIGVVATLARLFPRALRTSQKEKTHATVCPPTHTHQPSRRLSHGPRQPPRRRGGGEGLPAWQRPTAVVGALPTARHSRAPAAACGRSPPASSQTMRFSLLLASASAVELAAAPAVVGAGWPSPAAWPPSSALGASSEKSSCAPKRRMSSRAACSSLAPASIKELPPVRGWGGGGG